jgi:hypothetical protein
MAANKQNRCWPGYEPVKGKDPHSQGSCRPKAESKLTESEKEFRAARKRQLQESQGEHPPTRKSAAQHLRAPGAKKKPAPKAASGKTAPRGKRAASSTRKRM